MNQQTAQIMSDWLQNIASPLKKTSCGEDPRYLDEFQRIKEELDKLRDVDYPMIMDTCRALLTKTTKDLRVAGYLIVASAYIDGLPGLLDSLKAYRALLNIFWEDCHPLSESGRLAALNLLGNPRIVAFAELHEEQASAETFAALQQEIAWIHAFLTEKLGEEAPGLSRLAPWVEERLRRHKPIAQAIKEPSKLTPEQPSAHRSTHGAQEVDSEQVVEALTRQIHNYLINTGDLLRALAYSRAFRWGKLTLPPRRKSHPNPNTADQRIGRTFKRPGRQPAGKHRDLLRKPVFEPGFQLLFDLQFRLFQYFESNHREDLARFVRNALQELLERHPQLLELQFENGTPFANPECREWLQQNHFSHMNKAVQTLGTDGSVDESIVKLIETAMQMAKRKMLPEALHSLHALPKDTEQQRIEKHLVQARLCLAAGKAPMADVILEELQKNTQTYHLATWNPELAIEILQQRLTTLQSLKKSNSSEEKQRITQQWHEAWRLLCKIDVTSAAALNPV